METPQEVIRWAYTDPASPACYSSSIRVYKEAKKYNKSITKAQVDNFLQSLPSYTLHRKRRVHYERLRTVPTGFLSHVQADLADFQKVAGENDGYHYLLLAVDVLSRRIFAAATISKSTEHMLAAFRRLLRQMPAMPRYLYTDKGKEFVAHDIKKFLHSKGIQTTLANSPDVKAAVAERYIRAVKERLYKYFTHKKTTRWVDVVPDIVDSLNHSVNRITKMKPIDVNFTNAEALLKKLYDPKEPSTMSPQVKNQVPEKARRGRWKPAKYKAGDTVRVAKHKTIFEKSYLPNYTQAVYEIHKVKNGNPPTYILQDHNGTPIDGLFYEHEFSRAKEEKDDVLRVEKVLKERKRRGVKELFVKFVGRPVEEAAWISEKDFID